MILQGGNVLCLEIWKGSENVDPYLNCIQFGFSFGSFISPIIAEPFLCNKPILEVSGNTINPNVTEIQDITKTNEDCFKDDYSISGMYILYPIIGLLTLISSIGYFVYGMKSLKLKPNQEAAYENNDPTAINDLETTNQPRDELIGQKVYKILLVFTLLSFLFVYVGMEVLYGTYVATFAVESELYLSRQQAARVIATFWGSFAIMRFVSIFVAFRINAANRLFLSFILCGIGSIILAFAANKSFYILYTCSAVIGPGMASMWCCAVLWVKNYVTITNRIGSFMIVASSMGADLFLVLVGQFISTYPMLLMYVIVLSVFLCLIISTFAFCIAKQLETNPL